MSKSEKCSIYETFLKGREKMDAKQCIFSTKCEICLSTGSVEKYGSRHVITVLVKQVATNCGKRKGENIHVR